MSKKITTDDFIKMSKNIHGIKYDYSLVNYIKSELKVKIMCPTHGIFEQTPHNHLRNNNCPKCSSTIAKTSEKFINNSHKIHGNRYDYSLVDYVNNITKIKIICGEHGVYQQSPNVHSRGGGCPICAKKLLGKLHAKTQDQYINEVKLIHNNKYDYSLVKYINAQTKIIIICPIHGMFKQEANSHRSGNGCPICRQSKGEIEISKYLINNGIEFQYQKVFNDCEHKRKLRFDFYLPQYNTCVEYDGKQHFIANEYFGGTKSLESQKERDIVKNKYCKDNNIILIRIKYNENIKNKLILWQQN
jgi:very-short-patch-repair endonuclease